VVLDFLSTTDVGRLVPAEGDAGSEVPEWELRWRREREEERRAEAEEVNGVGEEQPLFLPTPSFMATAEEKQGTGHAAAEEQGVYGLLLETLFPALRSTSRCSGRS